MININNGAYYQRVNVTEDYTPRFSTIENFEAYTALGYSSEKSANIVPETNNVAGILSGKYKSTWTAEITGDNADEFYFEFGEGYGMHFEVSEDKNTIIIDDETYTKLIQKVARQHFYRFLVVIPMRLRLHIPPM